jgi:hypothetical protein
LSELESMRGRRRRCNEERQYKLPKARKAASAVWISLQRQKTSPQEKLRPTTTWQSFDFLDARTMESIQKERRNPEHHYLVVSAFCPHKTGPGRSCGRAGDGLRP